MLDELARPKAEGDEARMMVAEYLLIPVMAALLVGAQALWGSAIRNDDLLDGSLLEVVVNVASSGRIWLGAALYVATTGMYFYVLSKLPFVVIQVTMTSLALLFSTAAAAVFLDEAILLRNVVGVALVIGGLSLVVWR